MAAWTTNTIMLWSGNKITDHGRSALDFSNERIGTDKRMVDGTMRRQFIANKRTWSVSWENIPSSNSITGGLHTADGGYAGEDIENFYKTTPGVFRLTLKRGSANGLSTPANALLLGFGPFSDANFDGADVYIGDFSKSVVKRSLKADLWNINLTMIEV